ncbi:hypothetical protein RFI_34666, partial [Reticulomyxa filosa]
TKLQDVAMVSLRDVDRCLDIFVWLANQYFADASNIRQCLIISMGICYYYRLKPKERKEYQKEMTAKFLKILEKERDMFYVANTAALKEILFILFICIVTTTPSFVFFFKKIMFMHIICVLMDLQLC